MPCGNNKMGFSVRYVRLLFDSLAAEKRQTLKFMAGAAAGGGGDFPFRKNLFFLGVEPKIKFCRWGGTL